jgi:cyclopropane-fatty-acyl-phospholipid synthase
MDAAAVLQRLVDASIGAELPVRVECWDGSETGPANAAVVVRFTSRRALRRLIWAPNELGFARAYVSGDVEIDGDLLDVLTRLDALADAQRGPGVHVGPATRAAVARAVLCLGALGPPPRPPAEGRSTCRAAGTGCGGMLGRSPTTTTLAMTSTRSS